MWTCSGPGWIHHLEWVPLQTETEALNPRDHLQNIVYCTLRPAFWCVLLVYLSTAKLSEDLVFEQPADYFFNRCKDDTCFFCAHNCRDQFLGVSDLALAGHQLSFNPALKGQCHSMLVPSFWRKTNSMGPLIIKQKYGRILLRFRFTCQVLYSISV